MEITKTAEQWLEKAIELEAQGRQQQAELCFKKALELEARVNAEP